MNILVIGGAGYIGSFISRVLIERGYHVRIKSRMRSPKLSSG